ncbi:MAG: hypothetical protein GY809_17240 [Planctomycetes bacterium]|nr:hypothetical protein [Planctomycetota bacterium]
MKKKQAILGLSVVLVILIATSLVMAQQPQGGQRGRGGQGMRGFDPAQMQQRMMERMQEQLGMTATEMKAIQPLFAKVMDTRRELQGARFRGMMGGRGGRAGQQNAPAPTGLAKIQGELRTLLENDSAAPSAIKAKLTAYRKAREKIQQNLARAQANLIKVLTGRQEAALVLSGMLD